MATISHPVTTSAAQTAVTVLQPSETHENSEEGQDDVIGALDPNTKDGVSDVKDQFKSMKVEQATTGADVESKAPLFSHSGRH